jgi:hypothetical protein
MKTLKSILTALVLFVGFTAAKANDNAPVVLPLHDYAVYTYVNAVCHGQMAGIEDVLDKNVQFSMVHGTQVITSDKAEVMQYLRDNKNVEQNCTVSTSVVESNDDVTVVKVTMKYSDFVRTNYVTIANTSTGWKITNVHSVFKS